MILLLLLNNIRDPNWSAFSPNNVKKMTFYKEAMGLYKKEIEGTFSAKCRPFCF